MEKICFVIAPIGEPGSETRDRSDQILEFVISPAARECGYKAVRADQIAEPGLITTQVVQHILDDPLVIADLTDRNPNVFYELAIRHILRKPLVQIVKRGDQIPFDVANMRTIPVDLSDLRSVDKAKKEIVNQIKSLEKGADSIENPISVAVQLQSLRQSSDPGQQSLADILSAVTDLKRAFVSLEKQLAKGDSLSNDVRKLINALNERDPGRQEMQGRPQQSSDFSRRREMENQKDLGSNE